MRVTKTAAAAAGDDNLGSILNQVGDQTIIFPQLCTQRHINVDICATFALLLVFTTYKAVLGCYKARCAVVSQGIHIMADSHDNIATTAAIAAVRTTIFPIFFVTKRRAAIATLSGAYFDVGCVCKH